MSKKEDQLQNLLNQIEAGEPIQDIKADLPDEFSELLDIASSLRATQVPKRRAKVISNQRKKLLEIYKTNHKDIAHMENTTEEKTPDFMDSVLKKFVNLTSKLTRKTAVILGGAVLVIFILLGQRSSDGRSLTDRPGMQDVNDAVQLIGANQGGTVDPLSIKFESLDQQHAALINLRGIVEVKAKGGDWEPAAAGDLLSAGARIRSGNLSGLTLLFYDGSMINIGPNAKLTLNKVDAPKAGSGPRTIVVTQLKGESEHNVAHSDDPDSLYEVNTPSGKSVATGTAFNVDVTETTLTIIIVTEGSVEVTNLNVTVILIAGQTTIVEPEEVPQTPEFYIGGEGKVNAIGWAWQIAGTDFVVDNDTIITGNPMVGDWVSFEGSTDGVTRTATRITLLRRAPENAFEFSGTVDKIEDTQWTISGQQVAVGEDTQIDPDVVVGSLVHVAGLVLEDGSYLADSIDIYVGPKFEFAGVVTKKGRNIWTISGASIAVDENTRIKQAIVVGDAVKVEGQVLPDGTWLADEIEPAQPEDMKFEFYGVVESMDPWLVGGFGFEVNKNTEIKPGIEVGGLVKVEGRILKDGRWMAEEIKPIIEDEEILGRFEITGIVEAIDPWAVSGLSFTVDNDTTIEDGIDIGDTVLVLGSITLDEEWVAEYITEIKLVEGCLTSTTVVRAIDSEFIYFLDWTRIPVSGEGVNVPDLNEIVQDSLVLVTTCVNEDGELVIVSVILILYLEDVESINIPKPGGGDGGSGGGDKVTICHSPPNNPGARHTITVGASAVPAHLAHGDRRGPCK